MEDSRYWKQKAMELIRRDLDLPQGPRMNEIILRQAIQLLVMSLILDKSREEE